MDDSVLQILVESLPIFAEGLKTTLVLFIEAGLAGFCIGCVVALAKARYIPNLYKVAWLYVEICRNIPLLIILFFFYYGLQLTGYTAGLLALVTWASAFMGEVIRAGIDSIEREQIQAARLLGFSQWQLIIHLVLPQALVRMIPVLANQLMNLAKNTSIVYFVGVLDVTYAFELLSAQYFLFFQFFFVALACYVTLCLIIINLSRFLEHWMKNRHVQRTMPLSQDEPLLPA